MAKLNYTLSNDVWTDAITITTTLNNLTLSVRILQRNTSPFEIKFILLVILKKRDVDHVIIVFQPFSYLGIGGGKIFPEKITFCFQNKCTVVFFYMYLVNFEGKRYKRCSFVFKMFLCSTIFSPMAIGHHSVIFECAFLL